MLLSDLDIAQCAQCGKLYQAVPGRTLCRSCLEASETKEMAEQLSAELPAGLEPRLREKAMRLLKLLQEEETPEVQLPPQCVRCRQRPAIEDHDFCLACTLELYESLGAAMRELFPRIQYVPARKSSPSAVSLASEKLSRIRSGRVNPVGRQQLQNF